MQKGNGFSSSDAAVGRSARCGARLAQLEKGNVTAIFPLADKPLVIGRAPESDICVADGQTSKRHASASLHGSRLVVEDLNSSNGTRVNERKVEARMLNPGDVLRVGRTVFVYLVDDMPAKRADARAAGWLVGRKRTGGGLKAPVSDRPLLVGGAPQADIRLLEEGFADFQAQILAARGGAEVTELTERPPRRTLLADGEQLKIGMVVLKYLAVSAEARNKPSQPPPDGVIDFLEAEARRIEDESDASVLTPSGEEVASTLPKTLKMWFAARNGPLAGQDFPFTGRRMVIGWDRKAKIRLTDAKVSRFHASIRRQEGDVIIEDLVSETGVFVNGRPILRRPLKPGDLIRIGATDFFVHL